MLKDIVIKPLERRNDERGSFSELMREDWKDLGMENLAQANFSTSYPGIVRAWHRHTRGQTDYMIVLEGALKICVYDDETKELDEIISTGVDLRIVRVPGHYWHGFKVIGNNAAKLLYFTSKLYDYKNPDEERRAWDDQTMVPRIINGKKGDRRIGKPWDWNYSPHR